jgi:uncharacterized protein involved in exopolysaccharide biosynthesis
VTNRSRQDEKVNAEIAILNSPSLLITLVDRIGAARLYDYPDRTLKGRLLEKTKEREIPPIEETRETVRGSLKISSVPKSEVIEVGFEWPDPSIAVSVVNTLVGLYLAKHVEVHTDPQTYSLLSEQVRKWETKLRESEQQLEAFKRRHSITSFAQQRTILLSKLSETESEKRQTQSEVHETMELVTTVEAQLANLDQNVQLQETVDRNSATLAALKARLVDLELQGLKEEINRVKMMIAEEEQKEQVVVVSGRSPIRESLEGDLLRAEARYKALKAKLENEEKQIAAYGEELRVLDGFEKQLNELSREAEINEANYKLYLTKLEEAKISENMDKHMIANVKVIEPASESSRPIKPNKRLNVILGAFLGLLGGIGMAFLIERIHPVFRSRDDVDHFLGLPVLTTLPKVKFS